MSHGSSPASQGHALTEIDRSAAPVYVRWERQLPGLMDRLGVAPVGVVQVGAHIGQEVPALVRCGFRRLVMVEPNRDHSAALARELGRHLSGRPEPEGGRPSQEVVLAAAGRERGTATLHVTEYDQQASLLAPLPPMTVTRLDTTEVVPVREVQHGCNVLVVDAQGAELDVLAGADLDRLDLAVIEGSAEARYHCGATRQAVAAYMQDRGWRLVANWTHARANVADMAWLAPSTSLRATYRADRG
ncbi:FkbM family methyltransferase [Actinomadura citrea]|uniref:FkbM family methyltransferase n=1 Tax=Actinomadura TaxID=1988 RepID=UPI002E2A1FDF|nr:FkbM family methyltransferase [Actinomadura citrea]